MTGAKVIICEQKNAVVEWWWVEKIGKVIANIGTPQVSATTRYT